MVISDKCKLHLETADLLMQGIKESMDELAVKVYSICSKSSNSMKSSNPHSGIYKAETSRTLDGNGGNPSCNQGGIAVVEETYCMATGQANAEIMEEVAPTLTCSHDKPILSTYTVRRLTPTECARLQGFPDWWGHFPTLEDLPDDEYQFWLGVRNTHAAINGKAVKEYSKRQMLAWYNNLHTDSAEYKMWGNGIALPCAHFVMQGIARALKND